MALLLWHGYVSFDLSAHTAGERTSIMAALKTELDETPNADQPAERWHATDSGGVYIAEATFDLEKLSTANLNTVAQAAVATADLAGLWEPMRMNQAWERSLVRAHEFIGVRAWDIYGYDSFVPASNSLAAVQAAIDAAVANGSGVVDCTGLTITLSIAGTLPSVLSPTDYALLVDGDYVWIKNGTFVFSAAPATTNFTAIVFGNGGSTSGIPGENGTWRYGCGIIGSMVDGSALSDAEREAISAAANSHTIAFHYSQDWFCRDVTVTNGWGGNGVLGSLASSRYGYFVDCAVPSGVGGTGGSDFAYWIDGGRYASIINCSGAMPNAFKIQANLDNTDYAEGITAGLTQDCAVTGCTFTEIDNPTGRVAFGVTGGERIKIIGNTFTAAAAGQWWSRVEPYTRAPDGTATSNDCEISGNTMNTGASQRPVEIKGVADDANEPGTPLPVTGLLFQNNTVNGATRKAYFANALAQNCIISGNTYDTATVYGYANAGDEAAIVSANTLQ